ncbi:MAG TPA: EamA family transporter [Pyrinomonadaceae bacterium]|nr:EamA family transporter [Pyrinomonadaceae bacterium]
MTSREKWGAYGAFAAVCFFWGTTYLAIRVGLEGFPPMLLAGLRFSLAGAVLFWVMWRQQGARLPSGREWLDITVVALALLVVGNGAVVWAEQWISSGTAALLVATSPFWVASLERVLPGGERVGWRKLAGMLVGFAGLALLLRPELLGVSLGWQYVLGVLAIQLGCGSWSAGSIYGKQRPTGVKPLMSAALQMLVAGGVLTLLGTGLGEWGAVRPTGRSAGAVLYLIVFGSVVAYGSYTYAVQKLPLSLVTTYSYINPVIAVLLGWLLLGEPLNWRVGAATAVILLGVAMVNTSPRQILSALKWRPRARRDGRKSRAEVGGAYATD